MHRSSVAPEIVIVGCGVVGLSCAARLANAGIGEITRALWPLLAAALVVLLIITYVPGLTAVVWKLAS